MRPTIRSVVLGLSFLRITWAGAVSASGTDAFVQHPLPILYDGMTLRTPVHIFGKTLNFIVDSGSTISGVDARYAALLGEPIEEEEASGMNNKGVRLSIYRCPVCTVGDTPANLDVLAVVNLSVISKISGSQCDGILGMDFLDQHVISLDLDKSIMVVTDKVSEKTRHSALAVPMDSIFGDHAAVNVVINHIPLQMMIDTGDNGSMSLNVSDWKRVVASSGADSKTIMAGSVSGEPVQMSAARIDSLDIATNHYQNLVATLARNPTAPSTLGIKLLRRHLVTFDFPGQTLFLEPSSRFNELETTDMSGLHLVRQGSDTVVYAVDNGSPAAHAKLVPGDIIELIDGTAAPSLTLWEMRRALKIRDNQIVTLEVKRGNRKVVYRIALRNTL